MRISTNYYPIKTTAYSKEVIIRKLSEGDHSEGFPSEEALSLLPLFSSHNGDIDKLLVYGSNCLFYGDYSPQAFLTQRY